MPLVVTSSSYKIECFPQMIEVLPLGIMSLSFCTNVFYSSVYHYGCSLMCSGVSVCLLSVLLLPQRSCLLSLVAMVVAFMEPNFRLGGVSL